MRTIDFYSFLDSQLDVLIDKYSDKVGLFPHKKIEQNRSMAFLIWLLDFYMNGIHPFDFITEGKDDHSCDIMFSKGDDTENEIFYVIQAKRKSISNSEKAISDSVIKAAIGDFEALLSSQYVESKNKVFSRQFKKLSTHLSQNKGVRFLIIATSEKSNKTSQMIKDFNHRHGTNVTLEIFDIDRLRRDFVEFEIKGINVPNRLEYWGQKNAKRIQLSFERSQESAGKSDYVKISKPHDGLILLLKPKTIFELFQQFGFSLFHGNVRNPLPGSMINKMIVETLKCRPASFWYFNNGVTAITNLIPSIGPRADLIEIKGFQVINGAQTFYSIYSAYNDANPTEREIMDEDARITLRLIKSNEEAFNLEISRFTNSQNTILERDFHSNDKIQQKLQFESFKTNYWYEKRRGEFRPDKVPKGIHIISNERLALAFLVFYLEDPTNAIYDLDKSDNEKIVFKSRKNHDRGKLEAIFQSDLTSFDNFLFAWKWFESTKRKLIDALPLKILGENVFDKLTVIVLPLLKILICRYLFDIVKTESEGQVLSQLKRIMQLEVKNEKFLKKLVVKILFASYSELFKDNDELSKSLADVNSVFYEESYHKELKREFSAMDVNWASFPKLAI